MIFYSIPKISIHTNKYGFNIRAEMLSCVVWRDEKQDCLTKDY